MCEKDLELKKTVEQLVTAIGRGINMLKAFIKTAPRLDEMTSARSSFMALGYNIPSVLEKQFALKSLEKSLDSREVEEGASKIGTCRFVVQKILVSCAYVVMLTKYIFGKRANENTEIEEAVGVAQVSVPISNSVLTSLTINSLPQEIEDEVLDMVRIATAEFGDMTLARRALDNVYNTTRKKQTKTIMAAFMGSKVGKHLTREYGDRIESMTRDTVQRDGFINALNSVKDFDPTRPRSDPTMT